MGEWSYFFREVDSLTMNYGDPFLVIGKAMYVAIAAYTLCVFAQKAMVTAEESIGGLLHFVALLLVTGFLLGNYNVANPPPIGIGTPIKTLIPNALAGLTDIIESTRYDEAAKRCTFIIDHLESPKIDIWHGIVDAHALLAYVVVEGTMFLLGSLIMLPMMVSVIFLGIGALIWPLFIPWLMVPRMSWLFWNLLSYMLKYSFYRLFAVAITFIISGVLVQVIDHSLTLDLQTELAGHTVQQYSLAQFTGLTIIEIGSLIPLSIWAIKELPNALREVFSGAAGAGATFMRDAGNMLTAIKAK